MSENLTEWHQTVNAIKSHVVQIITPQGKGTGFLIWKSKKNPICAIATAAHVVDFAHYWMDPIRIRHYESGDPILLRENQRAIIIDEKRDTATIVFECKDLKMPVEPFGLIPEKKHIRVGVEVGWLGFPAMSINDLCFFSGRISNYRTQDDRYLIDGVAINGVSGGPTFYFDSEGKVILIGVVSAYIPNRATGESLPGLCVVADVTQLQNDVKHFKSVEEAKEEETTTPPPNAETNKPKDKDSSGSSVA